jgi:hypothetical protein
MNKYTERSILVLTIIVLIGYIAWIKLSYSMKMHSVLIHVTEAAWILGYDTGHNDRYPNFQDTGIVRVDLIEENSGAYRVMVPTNDGYVLRIEKTKDKRMPIFFVE